MFLLGRKPFDAKFILETFVWQLDLRIMVIFAIS